MESIFSVSFPEQASTIAGRVDGLYAFLIGISGFFRHVDFPLAAVFLLKYRRRPRPQPRTDPGRVITAGSDWIVIPLALTMVMFVWGAKLYAHGDA